MTQIGICRHCGKPVFVTWAKEGEVVFTCNCLQEVESFIVKDNKNNINKT